DDTCTRMNNLMRQGALASTLPAKPAPTIRKSKPERRCNDIGLGLLVHRYGPHIFHTQAERLVEYLSRFTRWRPYEHRVLAKIGRELYEKFFRGYTRKQWGLDPSELDKSVTARVPTRLDTDDRYFTDSFQQMPLHGYTRMFENMLDHPNIKLMLNADFRDIRD